MPTNRAGDVNRLLIDIDMDVDNTTLTGYPDSSVGDRSATEERLEKSEYVRTFTNVMDVDNDGVPGYADGIDKFGNGQADSCCKFEPMVVDIPTLAQYPNAEVEFSYLASDPDALTINSDGHYVAAPGVLRVWKKDGDQVRNPHSVETNGDFVRPGEVYSCTQLGLGIQNTTTILYVEAIDWYGFEKFSPITAKFYPFGHSNGSFASSQTIKVRPYYMSSENPSATNAGPTNTGDGVGYGLG